MTWWYSPLNDQHAHVRSQTSSSFTPWMSSRGSSFSRGNVMVFPTQRSTHTQIADQLDFCAMDVFQRQFFLTRQREWNAYQLEYPPLALRQGDLTDPQYFGELNSGMMIIALSLLHSGHATISRSLRPRLHQCYAICHTRLTNGSGEAGLRRESEWVPVRRGRRRGMMREGMSPAGGAPCR
jgi:hypothetical protein